MQNLAKNLIQAISRACRTLIFLQKENESDGTATEVFTPGTAWQALDSNRPTISVTMCTYNGARYLDAQIRSIFDQDWRDYELLIVDDASDDDTWQRLQEVAESDPRVRLFRNEVRLGVNANFERAFSLARGDFIAPADQDDIWAPRKLSKLIEGLGQASAVYCDSELIDGAGRQLGRRMSNLYRMYEGRDSRAFTFFNCASGHALLFRKELLTELLPIAVGRMYDQWIALLATARGGLRYIPDPLVQYRQHDSAVTDVLMARGEDRSKNFEQRVQRYLDDLRWLWSASRLPHSHQRHFQRLHKEFRRRADNKLSIKAVFLLWRSKHAVFFISRISTKARWKAIKRYGRALKLDLPAELYDREPTVSMPPMPDDSANTAAERAIT